MLFLKMVLSQVVTTHSCPTYENVCDLKMKDCNSCVYNTCMPLHGEINKKLPSLSPLVEKLDCIYDKTLSVMERLDIICECGYLSKVYSYYQDQTALFQSVICNGAVAICYNAINLLKENEDTIVQIISTTINEEFEIISKLITETDKLLIGTINQILDQTAVDINKGVVENNKKYIEELNKYVNDSVDDLQKSFEDLFATSYRHLSMDNIQFPEVPVEIITSYNEKICEIMDFKFEFAISEISNEVKEVNTTLLAEIKKIITQLDKIMIEKLTEVIYNIRIKMKNISEQIRRREIVEADNIIKMTNSNIIKFLRNVCCVYNKELEMIVEETGDIVMAVVIDYIVKYNDCVITLCN